MHMPSTAARSTVPRRRHFACLCGVSQTDATGKAGSKNQRRTAYRIVEKHGQSRSVRLIGAEPGERVFQDRIKSKSQNLVDSVKSLYLPDKYPDSVTPDYVPYQLWTVPTHILGSVSDSLATSTLLRALGLDAGPVGSASTSAAIKWITKDGIGAFGRVLVGGRLGMELDDDPRRWRMLAEFITSIGLALEISTSALPSYFLLLASGGNFAKAIAKGIGVPVFRVILTHFATMQNVGAVAAKEEVWEVTAQLIGYGMSVATLKALEGSSSWHSVAVLWLCLQTAHVLLRYKALSALRFTNLSFKRASHLVRHSVQGMALPSIDAANRDEPMLLLSSGVGPDVRLGCTLGEAWGQDSADGGTALEGLGEVLDAFREEDYLLRWRGGTCFVVLKEEFHNKCLLRALWQASWLHEHDANISTSENGQAPRHTDGQRNATHKFNRSFVEADHNDWNEDDSASCLASSTPVAELALLDESLGNMTAQFPSFEEAASRLGWEINNVVIKTGSSRISVNQIH